ncbi:MAG: DUF3604 domain-containing protein [Pseudomonadales bacterium]
MIKTSYLLILMALMGSLNCVAADQSAAYSPAVAQQYPQRVLFGDTHSHSNNSADSFGFGNRSQSPELAYRYALGETLTAHNGMPVKIRKPMDFLVVSDHAEYLGTFPRLMQSDPDLLATDLGSRWHEYIQAGDYRNLALDFVEALGSDNPPRLPASVKNRVWAEITRMNDSFYKPGIFTTFNAYEWTSAPGGNNLHRVVIFKDSAEKVSRITPFSALDSDDPEDLWRFLAGYEKQYKGQVLAIAHNGNLSNGLMFAKTTLAGEPLNSDYAKRRSRWEPIYEVTQVKGDGEAHPRLSPDDPFADYETWDEGNLDRSAKKEPGMLKHEYARSALKQGLAYDQQFGVNPFQFGLIGSTDIHTGFADPDESNFFGKFPDSEPSAERSGSNMAGVLWPNWRLASSGYAAVWAHENTRESIFAALKRRETYATTGSRIAVRVFGGWDFERKDVWRSDFAATGYERGVPMGSELPANEGGSNKRNSPRFMVMASRDPDGANIDRIQIVKGWQAAEGELREKVYDAVIAKHPQAADTRPEVGTVKGATYSNALGAAQLATVWRDPDFDPAERAFYYVRVLEIPTPRWTAYDASYFELELAPEVPTVTRERAYTSPIWYRP